MTNLFDAIGRKLAIAFAFVSGYSFALTSGPAMPEYNDFESIENTDLVNLATGEFTYTIPVMTVPGPDLGFPIVLNYHGNILAKQEASWVGLGWNIQAGAITRAVNNIPDDFAGDLIWEKIQSQRISLQSRTLSYDGVTVGISWNSETGQYSGMVGYGIKLGAISISGDVGVGSGGGLEPSVGAALALPIWQSDNGASSAGLSIGVNSRDMNPVLGMTASQKIGSGVVSGGMSTSSGASISGSLAGAGVSLQRSGFSVGLGAASISKSSSVGTHMTSSTSGFVVPIPTPIGYFQYTETNQEIKLDGLAIDGYYGFLYEDAAGMGCVDNPATNADERNKCSNTAITYPGGTQNRVKKMEVNDSPEPIKNSAGDFAYFASTSEDIYNVATQGISGLFRPYRTEDGDYYSFLSKKVQTYEAACDIPVVGYIGELFNERCNRTQSLDYAPLFENGSLNPALDKSLPDLHGSSYSTRDRLVWRFDGERGGALFTDPKGPRTEGYTVASAPNVVQPYFINGKIEAWVITKQDGVKYYYTNPQYNFGTITIASVEESGDKWTRQEQPGFAYAWLLTAIAAPDFVRLDAGFSGCKTYDAVDGQAQRICLPVNGDIGGWVKFSYTTPKNLLWQAPYTGRQKASINYKLTSDQFVTASGVKSFAYLAAIETPTHKAVFSTSDRDDGLPVANTDFVLSTAVTYPASWASGSTIANGKTTFSKTGLAARLSKLNSIVLFNKVFSKEVSTVTFKYDYSLAGNTINSLNGMGKLTLKSITQGAGHNGPFLPSYTFNYGPNYDDRPQDAVGETQNFDMWGYRCNSCREGYRDPDGTSNAWNLSRITSPSGNAIAVEYAPKRIKYVEDNPVLFPKGESYTSAFPENGFFMKAPSEHLEELGIIVRERAYYSGTTEMQVVNNQYALGTRSMQQPVRTFLANYHTVLLGQYDTRDYATLEPLKSINLPRPPDKYFIEFPQVRTTFYRPSTVGASYSREQAADPDNYYLWIYNDKAAFENDRTIDGHGSLCGYSSDSFDEIEGWWNTYGLKDATDGSIVLFPSIPKSAIGKSFNALPYGIWLGDYGTHQGGSCSIFTNAARRQQFRTTARGAGVIRVWALYNSDAGFPQNGIKFGGGSAVSKLKFIDPIAGSENTLTYSYDDGSTPTLPLSMSNYRTDFFHNQNTGTQIAAGIPSVVFGTVRTNINSLYSETYHFINGRNSKSRILSRNVETGDGTHLAGANARIEVIDKSNLWGRLWKKEGFNGAGALVRTDISKFAINWGVGDQLMNSTFPEVSGGVEVLENKVKVASGTVNEKKYLGLTQKLYSNRHVGHDNFGEGCNSQLQWDDYRNCLEENGIFSTQVSTYSVEAYQTRSEARQDGVEKVVQNNFFDFLTGSPLISTENNTTPTDVVQADGRKVIDKTYVKYSQPAYWEYNQAGEMKARNMLSQTFADAVYEHQGNIDEITDYTLAQLTEPSKVVSAGFTKWSDAGRGAWRKTESFALKARPGFAFPGRSTSGAMWQSQGADEYNEFGHIAASRNAAGIHSAVVYAYGKSLPAALATNSKSNQVYYQSFETDEFKSEVSPGFTSFWKVGQRAKSGSQSLRVANCMEENSTGYVNKPACLNPSVIYWKGQSIGVFGCPAGFSEHFTTKAQCDAHFDAVCPGASLVSCRSHVASTGYNRNQTFTCFDLPKLPVNQTYVASAWYYDEFQGSDPQNPTSTAFTDPNTAITRPGIFIGQDGGCASENHPNGVKLDGGGFFPGAAAGTSNVAQMALGDKKWKRISTEYTPGGACSVNGQTVENAILCLYSSKGRGGSDIYYDEVRVRPKNSIMTTSTYDMRGNITSMSDANEVTKSYRYDALGKMTGIRNADGVLLSEQAKSYGKNITYYLKQTGNFIQGCEEFFLTSDADGEDSRFEFVSVDAGATYSLKTNANGTQVNTLCYEPGPDFKQVRLRINASGEVKSFAFGARLNAPVVFQTVVEHAYNAPFPNTFDGKIYNMKGASHGSHHFDAFHAFHLPSRDELVAMNKISVSENLARYKIDFEILNIPNIHAQTNPSDIPSSNPAINVAHRMHFKFNFFDMDFGQGGPARDEEFRIVDGQFKLFANSAIATPITGSCFGNPIGRCYDVVKYGEVKCIVPNQTQESDCNPPLGISLFSLRKSVDWPVAYAQTPIPAASIQDIQDQNYYHGGFGSIRGKRNTFVFGLYRYFKASPNEFYSYDVYWHPQGLSNVIEQNPSKPVSMKITVTPITNPSVEEGQ